MRKIAMLGLFCIVESAAGQNSQYNFTIHQIDSITAIHGAYGRSHSKINSEKETISDDKKTIVSGNGGSGTSYYLYDTNEEAYKKLSKKEKQTYDYDRYSVLIKGAYRSSIGYGDGSFDSVFGEFYYNDKGLFYVKLKNHNSDI